MKQDLALINKLGLDTQAPNPSMSAPEVDCDKALSPAPACQITDSSESCAPCEA